MMERRYARASLGGLMKGHLEANRLPFSPLLLHTHARLRARRVPGRAEPARLLHLPPLAYPFLDCLEVVDGGPDVEREDGVAVPVVLEVVIVDHV